MSLLYMSGGKIVKSAGKLAAGGPTLLQPSDITFDGKWSVGLTALGADMTYAQGFAVRIVSGDVRGIIQAGTVANNLGLYEFSLNAAFNTTISASTQNWTTTSTAFNTNGPANLTSLWWDSDNSLLWQLSAPSYSATPTNTLITIGTLGASGTTVSSVKTVNLSGIDAKRAWSGVMSVPAVDQALYSYGPRIVGLGAYTSQLSGGGGCSMGPSLFTTPDPSTFVDGATITSFKTLANTGPNARGIRKSYGYTFTPDGGHIDLSAYGYSSTTPTGTFSGDGPINYYGAPGGDPRPNGSFSTPPNFEPVICDTNTWCEPKPTSIIGSGGSHADPNGNAYWVWADRYDAAAYLRTSLKYGVIMVGNFSIGRTYYMQSNLDADNQICEIHFFDPAVLANVANSGGDPTAVQPYAMLSLPDTRIDNTYLHLPGVVYGQYEPTQKKLYVFVQCASGVYTFDLYRYSVNS